MDKQVKYLIIFLLFPLNLNAIVFTQDQWVELYLRDCKTVERNMACKKELEKALGKMADYKSMTFKYLDKEGLPRWLATIPIVESSYNKDAVSKVGALGLWQLMPYNIQSYKTKKIILLDYKMIPTTKKIRKYGFNPVSNTEIASLHFSKLFLKYRHHKETEKLAVLAYNSGGRRVDLWLSGKSRLPDETHNYYNKIMAIQYIIKNLKKLNVKPVKEPTIFEYVKSLI